MATGWEAAVNPAGFARAVAEILGKEMAVAQTAEVKPDCVCLACHTHLLIEGLAACEDCDTPICPACGKHGQITPFGTWNVPPILAASVRASVGGKPN